MSLQLFKRLDVRFFLHVKFQQLTRLFALFGVLFAVTACETSVFSTQTPAPQVIATAMAAIIEGQLVEIDGCLRVKDSDENVDYALVWPPDLRVTRDGDNVNIVTGIVTGDQSEILVQLGDWVSLGGGETRQINEELLKTLPPSCQAPYWVVGYGSTSVQVIAEPNNGK